MNAKVISKNPSLSSLNKLMKELKGLPQITGGGSASIVIAANSYKANEFALYFPGIDEHNWKYFETWKEFVDFCIQLIEGGGVA